MQVTDVTFYDTLRCAVKYKFIEEDSVLLNAAFNKSECIHCIFTGFYAFSHQVSKPRPGSSIAPCVIG